MRLYARVERCSLVVREDPVDPLHADRIRPPVAEPDRPHRGEEHRLPVAEQLGRRTLRDQADLSATLVEQADPALTNDVAIAERQPSLERQQIPDRLGFAALDTAAG